MTKFVFLLLFLFAAAAPAFSQNCSPFMGIGNVQFEDNSGAPLINGALYTFVAGSSTQAPTFSDSQCSQLNVNPLTFGNGARAAIWVNTSNFFKYVLCSSSSDGPACAAGDVLFSVDNVPGGSSGGGGGGSCSAGCTGFFISGTASPSTSGVLRMASGDSFGWRNAAGSANILFSKDANDILTWAGGDEKYSEINCPTTAPTGADLICADITAHRFKIGGNGGTMNQAAASGVDINTSDQVSAVHFGASQAPFSSTLPSTNQYLQWNGSQIVGNSPQTVFSWGAGIILNLSTGPTCPSTSSSAACAETVFAQAHTLVRLTYILTTAPGSCSTNAVVSLRDVTASSNVASITVNQGSAQFVDSGALSNAMTAGDTFTLGPTTSASGCSTQPVISSLTAVIQ